MAKYRVRNGCRQPLEFPFRGPDWVKDVVYRPVGERKSLWYSGVAETRTPNQNNGQVVQTKGAAPVRSVAVDPASNRMHPEVVIALARSYFGIGQPEKGREALAGLVTARCDPRQVFAAALVASRANQYDIAEKLFHSIRSTYPDRETLEYNLALVAYRSERLEQSAHILRELIRAGAGNGDVYSLLGWCYQKQHRSAEAVHAFEQAIRRDPDNELTYLDLATLLEDSGRLKAGLAVVKAALDRLPRSSRLWEMRGRIEVRTEQYQEAVTSYAEAIRLAPDSPEAHLGQAIALSSAGRIPQARAAFENGIQ